MEPPPELVYRRLNFPDGVPLEYRFTTKEEDVRRYGGLAVQRMTVDTWLRVIDEEKRMGSGHVGPTGVGNVAAAEGAGRVRVRGVQPGGVTGA